MKTFRCELLDHSPGYAAVIYRLSKPVTLGGLVLPRGTVSVGYFWALRNYNVYHFVNDRRETLACYVNISDLTRIEEERIYWRDLAVDLLITADGNCQVLDEHEIPEQLSSELKTLIYKMRDQLLSETVKLVKEVESSSRKLLAGK